MTNKDKPGLNTEASLKKWLGLPYYARHGVLTSGDGVISLYSTEDFPYILISCFSLNDVILKRYPKRKKKTTKSKVTTKKGRK